MINKRRFLFFPFVQWLPRVTRNDLRVDLVAAFSVAMLAIPQGLAFAMVAGLPPEYGLFAGMVPSIIAAFFGSSRCLVSGPTTTVSIVVFSAVSAYAQPESPDYIALTLTLTLMVGLMQLLLGLTKMGTLVNFISQAVMVGFTAGAAILIIVTQLKHFFGIDISNTVHLYQILLQFIGQLGSINWSVTSVAIVTLLSGIGIKYWFPKAPHLLIALLLGSLAASLLNLWLGVNVTHITMVGALPDSFPPLSLPELSLESMKNLSTSALALSLFALTEAVSIARAKSARSEERINGNQEFISQGLANIFGSFFSAYVISGSASRTGVNNQNDAKTPFAAIIAGIFLIIFVLLLASLTKFLPHAGLAGILFLVAWGLIDFKAITHILYSSKRETIIMGATFFSALFLALEVAIFIGILLSLILYLEKVSKPRMVTRAPDPRLYKNAFSSDPELPQCPQLGLLRIDGSLFFGSVDHVQLKLEDLEKQLPQQKFIAIEAQGINFVDIAGGKLLQQEAERRTKRSGGFFMIHVKQELWESLDQFGNLDIINPNHVFQSKTAAIKGIYNKLDKSICSQCEKRIFKECNKQDGQSFNLDMNLSGK